MNAKGTRFLAVLAVMAMAFVAFAAVAPSETNDATNTGTPANNATWDADHKVLTDPTNEVIVYTGGELEPGKVYYINSNVTITFPTLTEAQNSPVLLLIEQGNDVQIDVTAKPAGDMYIAALSVVKSTNAQGKTIYTSPEAAGTGWCNTGDNKLVFDQTYSEDKAVVGHSVGIGDEDDAGLSVDMYALTTGMAWSVNGGTWHITDSTMTFAGTSDIVAENYVTTGTSTWTFIAYTGEIKTKGGVDDLALVKFSGTITIDNSTQVATITKWTSGDVDVITATTAVILGADIQAGSTLYIDGGAAVTTAASISHAKGAASAVFNNYGAISIKQGTSTITNATTYGVFTLGTAEMKNFGSINNLGQFVQTDTNKLTNETTGKITTGYDTATTVYWDCGNGKILNLGTFTFKETTAPATTVKFDQKSTGSVVNDNSNVAYLSGGNIDNDNTWGVSQTIILTGNATIKGTNTLNGVLVIQEGVTLTIIDGGSITLGTVQAAIVNYGTIVVQSVGKSGAQVAGGIVANNGFIYNYGEMTFTAPGDGTGKTLTVDSAFVKNGGVFTNSLGTMEITGNGAFYNFEGADFNMSGTLQLADGSVISNSGDMTIEGTINTDATNGNKITFDDEDATITIVSLSLPTGKLVLENTMATDSPAANRTIELGTTKVGGEANAHILSGLVVSAFNIPNDDKDRTANYGYFFITGNVAYYTSSYGVDDHTYDITLTGKYAVIGDLTVQQGILLKGDYTGTSTTDTNEFFFIGEVMITTPGSATISGVTDVTIFGDGEIIVNKSELAVDQSSYINAAMYTLYVGFDKVCYYSSLANAVAGAAEAGATQVIVTGEVHVHEDVEVPAGLTVVNKGQLIIRDGATLEILAGAQLNNLEKITVEGALYAESATSITGKTTDTSIVSDVKVTGEGDVLYTNLYDALALAEEGDTVVLTKVGDAVVLTKDTVIGEGVILDTNGKELRTYDDEEHYTLTIDGVLVLYGSSSFKNFDDVELYGYIASDVELTYTTTKLAGAYFYDDEDDVYYIAGVQNLGEILSEGIMTVTVWGDVEELSLEFAGVGEQPTVIFKDNVYVTQITADNVKIVFTETTVVDAIVTSAAGSSIDLCAVAGEGGITISISESGYVFSGIADATGIVTEDDFAFTIVGEVGVSGEVHSASIIGTASAVGDFVVENTLAVLGTFIALKNVTAQDMAVVGNVDTIEKGKITVENGLTVGDVEEQIGIAANVSGDVVAKSIIVFADSTIDDEIIENMNFTTVTVDKELWFTVFGKGSNLIFINEMEVPVEDAKALDGTYDGLVVKNGVVSGAIVAGAVLNIDLSVDYYIYDITIFTDGGIKSITIDGVEMAWDGANTFTSITPLKAGVHKITYTLKSGYEETKDGVHLKTEDGTILKDFAFTTSGTEYTAVKLLLNGTQPYIPPEPEPVTPEQKSEWTITTILLVVLVILIAIMAVIVAMRLNRS